MAKLIFLFLGALFVAGAPGRATAQMQSSAPVSGDTASASVDLSIREGLAAAARSDWPVAVERFMQAHLLAPDNPVPLYNLGLAHMTAGHSSAAIAWWEAYLAAAPQADNAGRIRAEIGRLHGEAVATVRRHLEAARSNLGQLSGPEREQQESTLADSEEAVSPLFAPIVTDSVRFRMAQALYSWAGEPSASLAFVQQIADSVLHDERLAGFAAFHAYNDAAMARRYASAIFDATRRAAALATIDEQERAIRLDTVFHERLRRGEYPAEQVAAYLARGGAFAPGQWEFRNLVSRLARHGFHDDAERLASQVTAFPERENLLHLLAAAKLRAGDFDGALRHAREILAESRTPRSEVMLAAEAVRRITSGDVERGLRTLRERVTDGRIQGQALATVASRAKERGDAALAERATQLQRAMPAVTSNASINVLALAIAEDYETALAMASINNPSEMWGWFDGGFETGGSVQDFLHQSSALEADYAKVAFVAALRGRDREVRRALEMATDSMRRYWVYRNVGWAHVVAGRFGEAIDDVARWPSPSAGTEAVMILSDHGIAYERSRAQVLAAAATRAARAGRFAESERAISALRNATRDPRAAEVWARLTADAAMDLAEAYARRGDGASADRLYRTAADAMRDYLLDASVLLSLQKQRGDDPILKPAIARLRAADPEIASTLARPAKPEVATWSRAALEITRNSQAVLLGTISKRDPRKLPELYSLAARFEFANLLRILGARAETAPEGK